MQKLGWMLYGGGLYAIYDLAQDTLTSPGICVDKDFSFIGAGVIALAVIAGSYSLIRRFRRA